MPITHFEVDSSLLSELGERLVSDPQVAFTELIKNSYDADSITCNVSFLENSIIIKDDGHGMKEDEFKTRWMRVATSNKTNDSKSRKFSRALTGAKGVGRFASRALGDKLTLITVAQIANRKYSKIRAEFDWKKIDEAINISDTPISYSYEIIEQNNIKQGTILKIEKLKDNVKNLALEKQSKTELLKLSSPHKALQSIKYDLSRVKSDPGFTLNIAEFESSQEDLSNIILDNYVGRAVIERIDDRQIEVKIYFKNENDNHALLAGKYALESHISNNVYADIRYFPSRKGLFAHKEIDGRQAKSWLRDNSGVSIFDNGFRIKPYGEKDDDWLHLDADNANSSRNWRSRLTQKYFPMRSEEISNTQLNPMLYLPKNHQVIGAVFVSTQSKNTDENALIPSMDRMGFINNDGYKTLQEIIRFGLELLALYDKRIAIEKAQKEYELQKKLAGEEIQSVILSIEQSLTLSPKDKLRLTKSYSNLTKDIQSLEEYDRKARQGLEYMGLLGSVAGFMTHEHQSTLYELNRAIDSMQPVKNKIEGLEGIIDKLQTSVQYLQGYINYTSLFIKNINPSSGINIKKFSVKSRFKYILEIFKKFGEERSIKVELEIEDNILSPNIPVAMYDGIIHNLYTNALKILISSEVQAKTILFTAYNVKDRHIFKVIDNGPGIPYQLKNRIWDALYTTTSSENNPLGTGMGLGLAMVKKSIESVQGKITIIEPPKGYSTCFKISLPLNNT